MEKSLKERLNEATEYKVTQKSTASRCPLFYLTKQISIPSYKFIFGFTTGYVQSIRTFVVTSFMFPVSTSMITKKTQFMDFWALKFQRKTSSSVSCSVILTVKILC